MTIADCVGVGRFHCAFLTQKERDIESGLDYFGARYYSPPQGRFTSPDPLSFWMLAEEQQVRLSSNPQTWNKYVYVLNNPLRYVDPTGLADVPAWDDLDKKLRADLAKRKVTKEIWNQWNNDRRQGVLNARAALQAAGVWSNVTTIGFARVELKESSTTSPGYPRPTTTVQRNTTLTEDNAGGWELAITTNKDIRSDLEHAGYIYESPAKNHLEAEWTYKQSGDDIVFHVIGLLPPANQYQTVHFDAGGGGLSWRHARDWLSNAGVTQDEVTHGLRNTPAAQYLRGISPDIDRLLKDK